MRFFGLNNGGVLWESACGGMIMLLIILMNNTAVIIRDWRAALAGDNAVDAGKRQYFFCGDREVFAGG
jgi:hypothetical protein